MIILNNMYTGRYISSWGNLGHEAINLIRADDDKFYIWLNSMGILPRYMENRVNDSTIIMVRSINSHLYKVLAYAKNCKLCDGATISRKKKDNETDDKKERYEAQKKLGVTYNHKCPMDDIYKEEDMFATFCTTEVYEADGDIYLTNDLQQANPSNKIFYADFTISEAMRAYVENSHPAESNLNKLISSSNLWKTIAGSVTSTALTPNFNFFKLIRKEKDELSISNALAYFISETGIKTFLENCLSLTSPIIDDDYQVLREKNNIDISFFGKKNVVIIENKIDAGITYNAKITIDKQIDRAIELYYDDSFGPKDTYKERIEDIVKKHRGNGSQLSKYYIYAIAHLLSKKVDSKEIEDHIKCFLLIPEYSKNNFKTDSDRFYISDFSLSEKYKIITYNEIFVFYNTYPVSNPYFSDFVSALKTLASPFNNEFEEEMKYRFLKEIGK